MAGFTLEGKIHQIDDVQTFPSGFSKREFVVEVDGQYPQMVKFELIREKGEIIEQLGLTQGDPVTVHFDIRGNEYQGKYFVNLNCWKLERAGQGGGQPQPQQGQPQYQQPGGQQQPASQGQPASPAEPPPGHFDEGDEDIPF